ncbi:hypothetical protein DBR11_14645 [Pedobacter sp. HMWF019]|uniref:PAS domain-containing protein n=1 Tax=Pedobacter sp. HMWF019 TaxID=2056856 RepID=UPI000D3D48C4|nr:PAS domain-containing protein [Pedobacter sp. HMWF019]PTS98535.1 hypothetical protein DBR11_14645 [Pedobacter sp. HMWF019]
MNTNQPKVSAEKLAKMLQQSILNEQRLNSELANANIKLAELNDELSAANEELAAFNEELTATNNELIDTNHKLTVSTDSLAKLNAELEQKVAERTAELHMAQAILTEERDELYHFFMQAPAGICVLGGPDLVFELVNPAYQKLLPKRKLLGRPIFEALPELKGQILKDILLNVYQTGEPFFVEELLIPVAEEDEGSLIDRYFSFNYTPRRNEKSEVDGIMVFVNEVTSIVASRTKIADREFWLKNLVDAAHYPLMILRGRDWVIELANQALVDLWDKTIESVMGHPLMEILPEIADQPFPMRLHQVYDTGIGYGEKEQIFHYNTAEGPAVKYVSYYYDPLFDRKGQVCGIIVSAEDITEKVRSRQLLEQSYQEMQAINEALGASNEEISAVNEELASINEELTDTQQILKYKVDELAASEARFRFLIQQAPVAIAVLRGRELLIDSANEMILKLWGKNRTVVGQTLANALPELEGQPFLKLLDEVFVSSKPHHGRETPALLEHNGEQRKSYFNFVYHPLMDMAGKTSDIIVVAVDVTEQVHDRKTLERAEEMLRFSVEAASAATWYMDAETREFVPSGRLKELFGFHADHQINYDDVLAQIPEAYQDTIHAAVQRSVLYGENYAVEHPVISYDGKHRWVRALGRLYEAHGSRNAHFSGLMIEITEEKQNEQRKNDFIAMVSHELKTPLTSLKGIVQLLNRKYRQQEDQFASNALEKAEMQVKKMTVMINGFLNVSRLESGKIHLDKKEFDLMDLLSETVEDMALTSPSHTILIADCPPVVLLADREKIGSVISNLLSNAVKYSPMGKVVQLNCECNEDEVTVAVIDEGMGIKQTDIDHLFSRYYRVETQHTQNISGFGIGLYLSAEIVAHHGGRIGVESELGKGSKFWFTLKLNN